MTAAGPSCAVEIAGGVEDQVGVRVQPVQVVAEVTQPRRLLPIAVLVTRQLKRCASAISAARRSRAVEIASGVEDQAARGEAPSAPLGLKLCSTSPSSRRPARATTRTPSGVVNAAPVVVP